MLTKPGYCLLPLVLLRLLSNISLFVFQADDVTPTKLTMMATDITNGLAYLAEMKFIHRYV